MVRGKGKNNRGKNKIDEVTPILDDDKNLDKASKGKKTGDPVLDELGKVAKDVWKKD